MAVPAARTQIQGRHSPGVLYENAMRKLSSDRSLVYEDHEFLVPSAADDFSINDLDHATDCTCQRALGAFQYIPNAQRVSIRNTGVGPITVKYNEVEEDPITVEDGEKFDWDFTEVVAIFFANAGGSAVSVRVLMA